jgi:hypothetical protein
LVFVTGSMKGEISLKNVVTYHGTVALVLAMAPPNDSLGVSGLTYVR